ncbi:MAG: alpha/beta hydrolase [Candidatus Coproplasma sp.]
MEWYWIAIIVTGAIIASYIVVCVYVFKKVFGRGREVSLAEINLVGTPYEGYEDGICSAIKEAEALRFRRVEIENGCRLVGYYYDFGGKNTVIMFHGYHATPFNNFAVAMKTFKKLGFNVLLTVQRGHGESGGKLITFGVKEQGDCLAWVDYVNGQFRPENIVLYGVSMGSFSVMCLSDKLSGKNVMANVCDCGYINAYEEICLDIKKRLGFVSKLIMPCVRLLAIVFGGFDPAKDNACRHLSKTDIPTYFIHGEEDKIVPVECTKTAYTACSSKKHACYLEGCGHAQAFLVGGEKINQTLIDFLNDALKQSD